MPDRSAQTAQIQAGEPNGGAVVYAVVTTHPDQGTLDQYVRWLLQEHIARVIASGAQSAELVQVRADGGDRADQLTIMILYRFSDVAAYERYVTDHAPRLRAEGRVFIEGLPGGSRIAFERWWGEVVGRA